MRFCEAVATVDQAAAIAGTSPGQLTGREARWQNAETDLVGPSFAATWSGSDEEKHEAERERAYTQQLREKLWGDE